MRKQLFLPSLTRLEGRVVLSLMANHPTVHTAAVNTASTGDVAQEGDFQGQFGDQSGPDVPGAGAGEQINDGPADVGQNSIGQLRTPNGGRQTTPGAPARTAFAAVPQHPGAPVTTTFAAVPQHQVIHFATSFPGSIQGVRHRR
jgi:hypothetical protein